MTEKPKKPRSTRKKTPSTICFEWGIGKTEPALEWEIWVNATPVPASRPRVSKWGTYYAKRYKAFKASLESTFADINRLHPLGCGSHPLHVELTFKCPRAKTKAVRESQQWPKGDLDNYEKAVLDAATTGGLWDDDDRVVKITSEKSFSDDWEAPWIAMRISPHVR